LGRIDVGGKLGWEHLVESILEPPLQIIEGFRGVAVSPDDCRPLSDFAPVESDGCCISPMARINAWRAPCRASRIVRSWPTPAYADKKISTRRRTHRHTPTIK
jgi:hypothetical protein